MVLLLHIGQLSAIGITSKYSTKNTRGKRFNKVMFTFDTKHQIKNKQDEIKKYEIPKQHYKTMAKTYTTYKYNNKKLNLNKSRYMVHNQMFFEE